MEQAAPLRKLQQQVTFLGLMLGVSAAGFISDRCTLMQELLYSS